MFHRLSRLWILVEWRLGLQVCLAKQNSRRKRAAPFHRCRIRENCSLQSLMQCCLSGYFGDLRLSTFLGFDCYAAHLRWSSMIWRIMAFQSQPVWCPRHTCEAPYFIPQLCRTSGFHSKQSVRQYRVTYGASKLVLFRTPNQSERPFQQINGFQAA